MLHIKNLEVLNLAPLLDEIVSDVYECFGLDVITSAYRPGDPGVHGTMPLRAVDMRCRDSSIGQYIVHWLDARYEYDHARPKKLCAVCHDTGKGLHLHLQVHPNSKRRFPR